MELLSVFELQLEAASAALNTRLVVSTEGLNSFGDCVCVCVSVCVIERQRCEGSKKCVRV